MSLVPKDEMTTLRSAADSKSTAESAEYEIQLKGVAYAINEAANTGLTRVIYQNELLPEVESELTSKGYKIQHYGAANPDRRSIISWS